HRRTDDRASRAWTRWAQTVARRRWIAAGAATAVLAALVVAMSGLQLGSSTADSIAKPGQAKTALVALERSGIGAGVLTPHEVLVQGGSGSRVAAELRRVQGVRGAVAPADATWRRGGTVLVDAFQTADSSLAAGRRTLD